MVHALVQRPFFVLLMGSGAMAMMVPAAHALAIDNFARIQNAVAGLLGVSFSSVLDPAHDVGCPDL